MRLPPLDLGIIVGYIAVSVALGLLLARRANRSIDEYFVGGRSLSWWLAGASMVASAFAIDTPFGITGLVARDGVQGVWFAWAYAIGGAGTFGAFIFAALLRRSEIITSAELAELRYAGAPAALLRGFKGIYFGMLSLSISMGWVLRSVVVVCQEALHWDVVPALTLIIVLTIIYTTASGFWGVAVTDFIQFFVGTIGSLALGFYSVRSVGGIGGLRAGLSARYGALEAQRRLHFVPRPDSSFFSTFLVFITVKWWSNPSGALTQRVMATKDPRHATFAMLLFSAVHFAMNYWPMIVAALVSLATYPAIPVAKAEQGYARLLVDVLPTGMLGLMMASLTAAFMSTIDTQANTGASFIVNDIYRRFLKPKASMKHYVRASQVSTLIMLALALLMYSFMSSVRAAWEYLAMLTAGYGFVAVARWFWWRINAWSELAALLGSAGGSLLANYWLGTEVSYGHRFLLTATVSITAFVATALKTRPEPLEHLAQFCRKVKPYPAFWGPVRQQYSDIDWSPSLTRHVGLWMIGLVMVFGLCFGLGHLILGSATLGLALIVLAVALAMVLVSTWRP